MSTTQPFLKPPQSTSMDAIRPSQNALLALSKEHLGFLPSSRDSSVPKSYLEELKKHMVFYPHDVNFRLALEPSYGFGKVTCLENGCKGARIDLGRRAKVSDGGMKEGFGSLAAYRMHIAHHASHVASRHTRVKAEEAAKKGGKAINISPSIKRERSTSGFLQMLNVAPSAPTPITSGSGQAKLTSQRDIRTPSRSLDESGIKAEFVEAMVPRKRISEPFPLDSEPNTPPTSKRVKLEMPKTPLAQVNRNTGSSEQLIPQSLALTVDEARSRLNDVQMTISVNLSNLERLRRKSRKSKSDLNKIIFYTRELERLRAQKVEYNAAIPSMSPLKKPTKLEAKTDVDDVISPSGLESDWPLVEYQKPTVLNMPVASGSNVRLPDDNKMDVDDNLTSNVMARLANAIPAFTPLPRADDHLDSDGNFHGRGKDMFQGPVAKADDIDRFLVEAGNSEQFEGNESVDKALTKLGLTAQYQLLPGMEISLMPHQTIGVAWMLDKEKGKLKGGCLGDEMGLGKTVQMIALMVKNASTDPMCKTNLIIAPTALLDQWKLEIEIKTNNGMQCLIYHGPCKPKDKSELLKYDVILTTYATMALEWPDFEAEEKAMAKRKKKSTKDDFVTSDSDNGVTATRKKKKKMENGLLFQIDFYRIVLDEAQWIRNRRTRNSRSVTDLKAVYRWCLTGTPIINGLVDVYGYVRFLKVRPWYDFTEFNSHISRLEKKNPALAVARLQAVLVTFLLRRMKNSELDGKRLIELPEKKVSLVKLDFTQEEHDIYKMVEARTQNTFNRYLRAGTVLKNYTQVLVLLLRLRQICCHPNLIQEDGVAFMAPGEDEDNDIKPGSRSELTRAKQLVSQDFVGKMKDKLKQLALRRMEDEKESADATAEDEECPICFDAFTDPVVTPCTHIFCRECLINVLNTPLSEDLNEPAKFRAHERPCPSCRSAICTDKLFSRQAFEPTDADLEDKGTATIVADDSDGMMDVTDAFNFDGIVKRKANKGKGKQVVRPKRAVRPRILDSDDMTGDEEELDDDDDDDEMSDFIVQSGEDEEEKDARLSSKRRLSKRKAITVDSEDEVEDSPEEKEVIFGARKSKGRISEEIELMPRFLPSTKMKHMMECLRMWAREHPDEKTLIVSQWTGCLSLVSAYLSEQGVIHVKYQGDMNRAKRDQAVRVFMSKDKAQVMLMSLKCGGVGLNLTRANRVISLDLGWSQAIESQAFDRCHRLGQTRTVFVERLVISNTVEDRVLAMQERKQNLADGSLGEGKGRKLGRLSVRELANLFGLDHRGRVLDRVDA